MLKNGGVAVMPTDTLYGIVSSAFNQSAVERVYRLRQRNPEKPCIILIEDISELKNFSILLSEEQKTKVKEYWPFDYAQDKPDPVSIVLDCSSESLAYLHRGTKTLAFRVPNNKDLRKLLVLTGPLIAPSANPEGLSPTKNISEAKKYFGDAVDLYIDAGEISGPASKIIRLHKDGSVSIIRK